MGPPLQPARTLLRRCPALPSMMQPRGRTAAQRIPAPEPTAPAPATGGNLSLISGVFFFFLHSIRRSGGSSGVGGRTRPAHPRVRDLKHPHPCANTWCQKAAHRRLQTSGRTRVWATLCPDLGDVPWSHQHPRPCPPPKHAALGTGITRTTAWAGKRDPAEGDELLFLPTSMLLPPWLPA